MSLGPWCQLGFWALKATVCSVVVRAVALSAGEAAQGSPHAPGVSPEPLPLQPPVLVTR